MSGAPKAFATAFAPRAKPGRDSVLRLTRLMVAPHLAVTSHAEKAQGPIHGMPTGFTVSIDAALDRLIEAGALTSGAPLSFSLVIAGSDETVAAEVETNGQPQSVDIHVLKSE